MDLFVPNSPNRSHSSLIRAEPLDDPHIAPHILMFPNKPEVLDSDPERVVFYLGILSLEAQLPIFWVPVLGSLQYMNLYYLKTQEPAIWVPGLLGYGTRAETV